MNKIKAVLFDMDGTLIDSLGDIADAANYTLECAGYPTHAEDSFNYFAGDGVTKLIERILPPEKRINEEIEKMRVVYIKRYQEHCFDRTRPYGGMLETLEKLKAAGIKLAIVTNKVQEAAEQVADKLFGNGFFDAVCGAQTGLPLKPDPYLAQEALRLMSVKAEDSAYVGDTNTDMKTAVAAGCLSIGALWGFRPEAELLQAGARLCVKHPSDLIDVIEKCRRVN